MKRCAFLSMDCLDDFVCYDDLALPPLRARGWHVDTVSWRAQGVDWDTFQLVVIRSPWDYHKDWCGFLRVLDAIDRSQARLENSLSVVRWNLEKTYLRDLQIRGTRIVPTIWCERLTPVQLEDAFREFDVDELVVKPCIGAGADNTHRLPIADRQAWDNAMVAFADRPLLIQPFVANVLSDGEYSLFYFGGEYSHCIRKRPKPGDFRVQEEHGGILQGWQGEHDLRMVADQTLASIAADLLYARIDLVRGPRNLPMVMEVELIEPSLYFPFDTQSPERFAMAVDRLVLP